MVKSFNMFKSILLCFFIMLFSHIVLYPTPLMYILFIVTPALMAYSVFMLGIINSSFLFAGACVFNVVTAYFLPEISVLTSLYNTFAVLLPGFVCGILISKKFKIRDILIFVSCTVIIFPLISLAYAKYAHDFNLTKVLTEFFDEIFYEQIKTLKSIYPEFNNMIQNGDRDIFSMITIFIPGLIPAISMIVSIFYSIIIYAVSKSLLRKKMVEESFFVQGLDCIYLPRINTKVLFVLVLLLLFETSTYFTMALLNVFVILFIFFMLQGLSVIEYKLKQRNLNSLIRFLALLGIIIALFIVSALIPILNPMFALAILGISDSSNDYRKINSNKDDSDEI